MTSPDLISTSELLSLLKSPSLCLVHDLHGEAFLAGFLNSLGEGGVVDAVNSINLGRKPKFIRARRFSKKTVRSPDTIVLSPTVSFRGLKRTVSTSQIKTSINLILIADGLKNHILTPTPFVHAHLENVICVGFGSLRISSNLRHLMSPNTNLRAYLLPPELLFSTATLERKYSTEPEFEISADELIVFDRSPTKYDSVLSSDFNSGKMFSELQKKHKIKSVAYKSFWSDPIGKQKSRLVDFLNDDGKSGFKVSTYVKRFNSESKFEDLIASGSVTLRGKVMAFDSSLNLIIGKTFGEDCVIWPSEIFSSKDFKSSGRFELILEEERMMKSLIAGKEEVTFSDLLAFDDLSLDSREIQ